MRSFLRTLRSTYVNSKRLIRDGKSTAKMSNNSSARKNQLYLKNCATKNKFFLDTENITLLFEEKFKEVNLPGK